MSELATGPAIQSGKAVGLFEFTDWVVTKGYGSSAAWTPLKSAVKRILEVVEGSDEIDEVDVRQLNSEDYLARFEIKARGQIKAESIAAYASRFTRAVDAYRQFLDTGQPPRTPTRQRGVADAAGAEARPRTRPSAPRHAAKPNDVQVDGGGERLIDYPFPLRSGQIALLRLPARLERSDAERLAVFVRTLVFEPVLELGSGEAK